MELRQDLALAGCSLNTKTILITGARSFVALDLARSFSLAGMRVICADSIDLALSRYSNHVDRFYKIASPAFHFENFISDLEKIIEVEKIDFLVPTCEEIFYVAKGRKRLQTEVFCESFDLLEKLHHKWKFYQLLTQEGFSTPETHLWDGKEREGKWILKPVYSRFAAKVQVVEKKFPKWEKEQKNPQIIQKYIEGEKFCSYTICHKGSISAHGVYQVLHSMGIGSAICFESVLAPDIDEWIERFVAKIGFTGQIAFDFIRSDTLYCLECNPRATSGVHLFEKESDLARSFFGAEKTLHPGLGKIFHEHLFMLWYGLKQKEVFSKTFWSHFFRGKNPLRMKRDNGVFAALPFLLLKMAGRTLLKGNNFHESITRDIEYNGDAS